MAENNEYINQLIAERARAEAEKKALIEEFSKSIPREWTPEDLKEKIRDLLAKAYVRIATTIDSDDESLAYKAAWDIMKVGMGQVVISDANDPNKEFMDLMKSMQPSEDTKPADSSK